jgi:hypothetical protein
VFFYQFLGQLAHGSVELIWTIHLAIIMDGGVPSLNYYIRWMK